MAKKKTFKKQKKTVVEKHVFPREVKKWVLGIVLFLLAIIIVLSFFNKAGIAGNGLIQVLTFLIGKASISVPIVLILGAIAFLKAKDILSSSVLAMSLFILGVSGLFGSLSPELKQGGEIGYLVSFPILKLFSNLVSTIIFGVLIIISLFLFWYLSGKPSLKIKLPKKSQNKEESQETISFRKIFEPKFKIKEIPDSLETDLNLAKPEQKEDKFSLDFKKQADPEDSNYQFPPTNLLDGDGGKKAFAGDVKISSAIIKRTLENFGIQVEVSEINIGPTVTQYALKPAEGIKLSKITVLLNDLSLALASHPLRIEAPIPGRHLVGIEVPNKTRSIVRLRELIESPNFQAHIPGLTISLGRDVAGNANFADLNRMPHLLIAGATGTGKTICLNNIILSLLYKNSPRNLKMILVDPKRVEFSVYNDLPHLLCSVIYDSQKTINALKWLIGEMERRFEIMSQAKARDIGEFNQKVSNPTEKIPYIVFIVDELADLMSARGREMEAGIVRLAQMSRAVGIHLILATQRPSVEVVTGLIKANITSRIAFQVASQVDSRTILDMSGAEKLLGAGDMLYVSADVSKAKRIQAAYVSEKETKKIASFIASNLEESDGREDISGEIEAESSKSLDSVLENQDSFDNGGDPLYDEAKKLVIESRKASSSLLQRRFSIGYARAARLIDFLEERGVVGPGEGAKPRQVYINKDEM